MEQSRYAQASPDTTFITKRKELNRCIEKEICYRKIAGWTLCDIGYVLDTTPSLILVCITHLNYVILQASLYRGASRREKPRGRNQGLTQQKRQEIREAFELFDTDNSGSKINLKEIHTRCGY